MPAISDGMVFSRFDARLSSRIFFDFNTHPGISLSAHLRQDTFALSADTFHVPA